MACHSIHYSVLFHSSNSLTLHIKFTAYLLFYSISLSLPSISANLDGLLGSLTQTFILKGFETLVTMSFRVSGCRTC